ncbi:transglutaminase domain-containing protein [Candidatus Woesearchaeota archaeon]|nr:MAG: transglutaminase domain-containing protein [Candidatus Woesearchaeota archaeon]
MTMLEEIVRRLRNSKSSYFHAGTQTQLVNPELIRRIKQSPRHYSSKTIEKILGINHNETRLIISTIKREKRETEEVDNPSLDVSAIDSQYTVVLTEKDHYNPFIINEELVRIIRKHTRNCATDLEKARAIYDWIHDNIKYGEIRGKFRYNNSEEVLHAKKGLCGEMAFLYTTMARSVGLTSNIVLVDRDDRWKKVMHACSVVYIDGREILVDPAYNKFDIHHKRYKILSDREVMEKFREWRVKE